MLKIGTILLENPFALAALAGFSEKPMRQICRNFGAGYAINAMALGTSTSHEGDWSRRLLNVDQEDHPTALQIIGSSTHEFASAAKLGASAGFDAIDINFGCPAPKMKKKCRGGYLLGQPDLAIDIVKAVLDSAGHRCPVTVKMRKGIDDSSESRKAFDTILEQTAEAGVAAYTIHARTVEQKYRGRADWAFLREIKDRRLKATILGSGDLFSAEDCIRMIQETGVEGVTIARGAIGNPWIFRECLEMLRGNPAPPKPDRKEQRKTILEHYDLAVNYYGQERAERVMTKFCMKYASHHPTPKIVRHAFATIRNPSDFLETFKQFWEN